MGTRMAPSYANLFMGRLEDSFLKKQTLKPLCWHRFIDDIFLIWTHGEESLKEFLDTLNNFSRINFTWNIDHNCITFLDVNIKNSSGLITTSVHLKPTNHQQYLHFSSCHPNNTKRSLPYSLALRGKRITTEKKDLEEYNNQLQSAFEKRGYPKKLIHQQITQAHYDKTEKPKPMTPQVNLVTTYHPGLHRLNYLLKTGFRILENSPQTKHLLDKPPTAVFRQPANLRNILVHPKLPDPTTDIKKLPSGSYPCNKKACKTCKTHIPTTKFKSSTTGNSYPILGHHSCDSENLVYQIQCKKCPAQYVGLTTETLRKRMNGHRHDTSCKNEEKPVSKHAVHHSLGFDECFTVKVLNSYPKDKCNSSQLRRWELAYQHVTKSRDPPNLNIR